MTRKENSVYVLDILADLTCGWISGCGGVLVSHPLDTVKARLQTQGVNTNGNIYSGTWDCFTKTLRQEKFSGLFKGMSSPLIGTAFWNAVVFSSYGNSIRFLAGDNIGDRHLTKNVFLAGMITGAIQTVVICPLELTKTRLQIQSCPKSTLYNGLQDCIIKILKKDGLKGLFKGFWATFYRDIIGFPAYFCCFEGFCCLISNEGHPYEDLGPSPLALSGGCAGAFSWAVVFPIDVIKSRIQADHGNNFSGFWDCLRKSYSNEGAKIFIHGLIPTVLRGFPMNAAIFSIYTILMRSYRSVESSVS
ncbi:mitochondrial basic amino acids transporter isoform X2 [Hydra vulgaris]|uniref:Mitochondrial basic amino acids transporter isoform X2 n=1 Tax=Hydra vulgaris TaxID=6087 RepID=A0ABM4CKR6_HYDVU